MVRYWNIYCILLRNSLIRELSFKANFLLWLVTDLLWFIGQILFIDVLFAQTERIGDWTKWEVVLLIGTHQMISQIFQAIFYVNVANLPELIRTGRLDFMLLLPIDAQFSVSTRQFGLDNLANVAVGAAFVGYSLTRLGVMPSAGQWACYGVALLLGALIHYCMMFALATLSFWIVRAQGLIYSYFSIVNIARYPDVIFRGVFRWIFTWIVPVIVVANVPARVLARAGGHPGPLLIRLAGVCLLALGLSRLLWLTALRRYASASS